MPDDDQHGYIPAWDGAPTSFADYERALNLVVLGTKKDDKPLIGPRAVARLKGNAWSNSSALDEEKLAAEDGVKYLLTFLKDAMAGAPTSSMAEKILQYFIHHHRKRYQSMQSYRNDTVTLIRELMTAIREALKKKKKDVTDDLIKIPDLIHSWFYIERSRLKPAEKSGIKTKSGDEDDLNKVMAASVELWN